MASAKSLALLLLISVSCAPLMAESSRVSLKDLGVDLGGLSLGGGGTRAPLRRVLRGVGRRRRRGSGSGGGSGYGSGRGQGYGRGSGSGSGEGYGEGYGGGGGQGK